MRNRSLVAAAICGAIFMTGCGGGGGGGSTAATNDPTSSLSGTVAAGAPLVGYIAIKDVNGDTATATINADGSYTIDVSALTPPMLLLASGVSGGQAYTIISAATTDDLNGTVNITPLTDVIVGNVAGMDGIQFFNTPDFTKLTTANLDGAATDLKTRLQPLLDAAGISDIDLLNTSFSADHSGLDGLLDVLDIVVNPDTDAVTITYALNPAVTISDDLSSNTDTGTINLSGSDIGASIDAVAQIGLMMESFSAQFNAGIPAPAALDPYFDASFLYEGIDKTSAIGFFTNSDPVTQEDGAQFRASLKGFSIVALDTASTPQTATIKFGSAEHMYLINNGSGWAFKGNGYSWESSVDTETHRSQNTGAITTELNFSLWDNAGSELQFGDYAVITGPGLPTAGVVMVQYAFNNFNNAAGTDAMIYGYHVDDATIAGISDGSEYTIKRYRDVSGDTNVYHNSVSPVNVADASSLTGNGEDTLVDSHTRILLKRPLLSSETTQFATISAPTEATLAGFSDGSLAVSWTLPAGSRAQDVTLDRHLADGSYERAVENNVTDSALSTTLIVPPPGTTINEQSVIVFTKDSFGRTAATFVSSASGVPVPTPTFSPVGSWDAGALGFDNHILTFFPNGYYFEWCNQFSGCSADSYELGTYSITATGIRADSHIVEGEGGLDPVGYDIPVAVTGTDATTGADTILVDGAFAFTRMSDPANPIVGAWLMGTSGFDPASSSLLIFYANGTYFQWSHPSSGASGCGGDTTTLAEIGTYTFSGSQLTITSHIQNGIGGFDDDANPCAIPVAPLNATVSGDTLSFPDWSLSFSRVK